MDKINLEGITAGSNRKVLWRCEKGHEWVASIHDRTGNGGRGCPFCSGHKVCEDNCFATTYPKLAKQWHQNKNGNLTPFDVTCNSHKKVWWICEKGHEWETVIKSRKDRGCPFCSNKKVCKDNCLATLNPELAKQWDKTKNGDLTPKDVTCNSGKKAWWICEKRHKYISVIKDRSGCHGCPYCSGQKACIDNSLSTLNPKLAKQWNYSKNGNLTSYDVTCGSNKKVWWKCEKGHEWETSVVHRSMGKGCPHCYKESRKNAKL